MRLRIAERYGHWRRPALLLAGLGIGIALAGISLHLGQSFVAGALKILPFGHRGYVSNYDLWTKTVRVSGYFNPGFGEVFRHEMAGRYVRRVEIDSGDSGLEDALASARIIEARPLLTTVAQGSCGNGCTVMLMAGDRRLAQYDITLQLGADADLGAFDSRSWRPETQARLLAERNALLLRRGVPERYVRPGAALVDGRDIRLVASVELAKAGALDGLIDEYGRRISIADADARLAARIQERIKSSGPGLSGNQPQPIRAILRTPSDFRNPTWATTSP